MNNLAFDFSVDKENKTITVKREFASSVSLVWDAFTKTEILDQWWAPKPWQARTKSAEFKVGGRRLYAMISPDGKDQHWAIFDYETIEDQKRITGLDGFSDETGKLNTDMPRMHWEFNFINEGEKTLVDMLIKFDDFAQVEKILAMGFKEGFTIALTGLDELLNAGTN